uniref:Anti-proliferative protein domain-containing protein n=1 Tax=Sphenodon punctatus TaxID=8508 RepID=A0A8D0HAB7_SPHPU
MKDEVTAGVQFISRLVNRNDKLDKERLEQFGECLISILCERFTRHWYPEKPLKGQAYR